MWGTRPPSLCLSRWAGCDPPGSSAGLPRCFTGWSGSRPDSGSCSWCAGRAGPAADARQLVAGRQPQTGWWSRLAARVRAITRARAAAALTQNELLITPLDRPPCGDDPMLWKERHTSLGGGLRWLGSRPMVLFFSVLLGCYLLDVAYPVVARCPWRTPGGSIAHGGDRCAARFEHGAGRPGDARGRRLRGGEPHRRARARHLDQPGDDPAHTGRDHPRQAVWRRWTARRVGLALLVIWAAGLLLGAIHPLGVLAASFTSRSSPGSSRPIGRLRVIARQELDPGACHDFHLALDPQRRQPMADRGIALFRRRPAVPWTRSNWSCFNRPLRRSAVEASSSLVGRSVACWPRRVARSPALAAALRGGDDRLGVEGLRATRGESPSNQEHRDPSPSDRSAAC